MRVEIPSFILGVNMAHFAELDENNIVLRVIVVNNKDILDENGNESEQKGIQFCKNLLGQHTRWVQTSYNSSIRKTFAGKGSLYMPEHDVFLSQKPYPSWVFCTTILDWKPPVDYPADIGTEENPKFYVWDETYFTWTEVVDVPPPEGSGNPNAD